ncbi:hypothetical protein DYI37_05235 [Fulvimarina endophytica]|uniref:Uncharacterized protein n=1 Tax=Fulvimarina endophytica TaxID=2293836 RepID=A0A371X7Q5_9HYPH|nr:hypothetical protein [Fulvimarina endophytica]RFC65246.1 hypothetical protein DYI37_05235 [Fulvimarina endophytica]
MGRRGVMEIPAILGALIGLAIGIADYVLLGFVRDRFRQKMPAERIGSGVIIEIVRISQLVFFPIAGWYVGAYLL